MNLIDSLLNFLDHSTIVRFKSFAEENPTALCLYCEDEYRCQDLKGDTFFSVKKSKCHSYLELPHRSKKKILKVTSTILSNYEKEINFVIGQSPRKDYYINFLNSIKALRVKGREQYCYEHLAQLDNYILALLKPEYDLIKSEYPYGTETLLRKNNYFKKHDDIEIYYFCLINKEQIIELDRRQRTLSYLCERYPLSITRFFHETKLGFGAADKILSLGEEYWAEKEEKETEMKRQAAGQMQRAVKEWNLTSSIRTFSLYNYYPESSSVSDNLHDKNAWIWAFKNDRPVWKNSIKFTHKEAVNRFVSTLKGFLNYVFGANTQFLTLFCIPASTEEKTINRFADFSNELCKRLEMENGLKHIQFESETTPKHLGGEGYANIRIDENFFKGKYILLFDDIITSGASMARYARMLQSAGALVIAGISLGITSYKISKHPITMFLREQEIPSYYYGTELYTGKEIVTEEKPFSENEIAIVESVIVENSDDGEGRLAVFHLKGGCNTRIPISDDSIVSIGQRLDIKKCRILTVEIKGKESLLRIRYIS